MAYNKIYFNMDIETIKKNFDYYREQQGITITALASDLGVTRQTIYSFFRGGLTLSTLQKIADLVNVEPWELLKPTDHEETERAPFIRCPHCNKPVFITVNTHEPPHIPAPSTQDEEAATRQDDQPQTPQTLFPGA